MSRQTQDDRDEEIKIELLGDIRDCLKRLVEIAESQQPKPYIGLEPTHIRFRNGDLSYHVVTGAPRSITEEQQKIPGDWSVITFRDDSSYAIKREHGFETMNAAIYRVKELIDVRIRA